MIKEIQFVVYGGQFNKIMADGECQTGLSHPDVVNANKSIGKYKKNFLGCAHPKKKSIVVNCPKIYQEYVNENDVIDMIQSTIEHEAIHHVLWDNDVNLGYHHDIIYKITQDWERKVFYHRKNKRMPIEQILDLFPLIGTLEWGKDTWRIMVHG